MPASPIPLKPSRGFTLIELLVVISLISLLIGFTIQSIGSNDAAQLTNSGNTMVTLVNEARQIARSHQSLTCLVLVTNATDSNLNNKLLTIVELTPDSTAWKQASKWTRLPGQIIVDPALSSDISSSTAPIIPLPNLKFGTLNLSTSAYTYQVFLPNGRLLQTSNPPQYHLKSAVKGNENYYKIIVNPFTATPIAERP